MNNIHQKNIEFLFDFLKSHKIKGIKLTNNFNVTYFTSGAGTHLYLIKSGGKQYSARINHYKLKYLVLL